MPLVELIYDRDCPNVEDTRAQLRAALARLGLPAEWQEWDRAEPASPAHARRYGSPTVLVDGRDVAGEAPAEQSCCRVYTAEPGSHRGVPPLALIVRALGESGSRQTRHE